jgi:WD40 repeat protein
VRLWAVPGGTPRGELTLGQRPVGVRFAPDASSVLVADRDGTARLVALDGSPVRTFAGAAPLRFATFAADGTRVLTCGDEAVLWQVADGTELLRFRGHRGGVEHGAFAPDGGSIATVSRDGTICVWPTDPVAAARRLLRDANGTAPVAPASTTTLPQRR